MSAPVGNQVLDSLPQLQRARLLRDCEPIELGAGQVLGRPGRSLRGIHFPIDACISLLAAAGAHPDLEVNLIGNEGMLGASLLLGSDQPPLAAVVECAGTGLRIGVDRFRRCLRDSATLRRATARLLASNLAHLAQCCVCIRFHPTRARLARRLLMLQDRTGSAQVMATHQELAGRLGVLRSAVTIAAGSLQRRGAIDYQRGSIGILSRSALYEAACACYRIEAAQAAGEPTGTDD